MTQIKKLVFNLALLLASLKCVAQELIIAAPQRTCSENISYCTTEAEKSEFHKAEARRREERRQNAERVAEQERQYMAQQAAKKAEVDKIMSNWENTKQRRAEIERLTDMKLRAELARSRKPAPGRCTEKCNIAQ